VLGGRGVRYAARNRWKSDGVIEGRWTGLLGMI
jgi:hypothetical protein